MPLDPSIFAQVGQGVTPVQNPLDTMSRVMAFKQLANKTQMENQQFQDEQAMRHAYSSNTTVDKDNNVSFDRQGMIKDLAGSSNPSLAIKAQQGFAQMDNDRLQMAKQQADSAAQMMQGIQSLPPEQREAAYQQLKQHAIQSGSSPSNWLPNYDENHVNSLIESSVTGAQHIQNQIEKQKVDISKLGEENKAKELEIQGKRLGMETFKTYGNQAPGQPKGTGKEAPEVDPATLVPKNVPPDRQAKAFEEIGEAQNLVKNSPNIFGSFDRAAKNIHATDFVPGTQNADQKELHALLGPTFKDVEGTVRQAAMDNMFKNTTPAFGDDRKTLAAKREALAQYIQSKSSAPTAKGYGIDLSQYKSTKIDSKLLANPYGTPGGNQKGPPVGSVMAGHKFLGGDPNNQSNWAPLDAGR